jgi:hemolysin III
VIVIVIAPAGRATVAAAIYGAALIALFSCSALYHRWPGPVRFKPLLRQIDHSTIFVFIAASYTPVALVLLHGPLCG